MHRFVGCACLGIQRDQVSLVPTALQGSIAHWLEQITQEVARLVDTVAKHQLSPCAAYLVPPIPFLVVKISAHASHVVLEDIRQNMVRASVTFATEEKSHRLATWDVVLAQLVHMETYGG